MAQNMNLNALLHFHVIAKHRSLSLAAKDLHLSAPAVTHSLSNLETSLGEVLCLRNRSGFQLTSAGLSLFQTTQRIFEELEGFSLSRQDEARFDGILGLGLLDHFENELFKSALRKVVTKFPRLKLNVQSYDSDTINQKLIEGEISIGLGIFGKRSPRLNYVNIGTEVLGYYISDQHPLWKRKKVGKDDLFGQKTTWLDNQNRKLSDLEINIFVENRKYKMEIAGFSNNLSGALHILLSGHTVVPLPENYGSFIEKVYPVKRIAVTTKPIVLDQMIAYDPARVSSPATRFLLHEIVKKSDALESSQ